jgi:hypothetical protein
VCGARPNWSRSCVSNSSSSKRQERERQQKPEQARIDRLLDEAASLRRAADIRAYVGAVRHAIEGEAIIWLKPMNLRDGRVGRSRKPTAQIL